MTHNILRWGVLIFGLYAITKSARGLINAQTYDKKHRISASLFVGFLHLQVVLGLVLYFYKGWHSNISNAFADMGNSFLRFWSIEHLVGMLAAAILIQIGSSKSKRRATDRAKHKTALIYFTVGMIIILATIPWPFRETIGRALWP